MNGQRQYALECRNKSLDKALEHLTAAANNQAEADQYDYSQDHDWRQGYSQATHEAIAHMVQFWRKMP